MMALTKGDIEIPSDIFGLIYEPIDAGVGCKLVRFVLHDLTVSRSYSSM
jgi:hypothetical protein